MLYRYEYKDGVDRNELIEENKHLFFIEEQNLFTGNFLVFSDEEVPVQMVYTQIPVGEIEMLRQREEELTMTVDSILLDVIPNLFG